MKKFFKKIFITTIILSPSLSYADLITCGENGEDPCNWADFMDLIKNLIVEGVKYAILFSVIVFVIAGYTYLTSNGDEGKVKKAHNMFKHVIVGLLIAFLSFLIVAALIAAFGGFRGGEIYNSIQLINN